MLFDDVFCIWYSVWHMNMTNSRIQTKTRLLRPRPTQFRERAPLRDLSRNLFKNKVVWRGLSTNVKTSLARNIVYDAACTTVRKKKERKKNGKKEMKKRIKSENIWIAHNHQKTTPSSPSHQCSNLFLVAWFGYLIIPTLSFVPFKLSFWLCVIRVYVYVYICN